MALPRHRSRRRASAHTVATTDAGAERVPGFRSLKSDRTLYRIIAASAVLGTILTVGLAIAGMLDWSY